MSDLADVLSDFARTMLTDFPIERILDHLVGRIVDVMPVTAAGVSLISAGTGPRYIAASNDAALAYEHLQTKLDQGPCIAAYHSAEAISVPDLRADQRFPRFCREALDQDLGAVFAFPLRHGTARPLGALDLYRDEAGGLSPGQMADAQTLADVAAAYLINARARSDLLISSEKSREAALHDSLTGLANRDLMLERIAHASLRARRSAKTSMLLYLDLDRFKVVNDLHGHRAGDELLVAVADRLVKALRPGDTVARLAGDEFAILCEDLDSRAESEHIVARVHLALSAPVELSVATVSMTASLGVAFAGGEETPEDLLHTADVAMYRAKRGRPGREHLPDLRELDAAADDDDLAKALSGVVGRQELHLEYQPIVAADTGQVTEVEALLRWSHPNRGPVPPGVLIPLADESGLILEIGRWVLEQAWGDQHRWQRELTRDVPVSVNISARQLLSEGFVDVVAGVLAGAPARPELLTLEVTESVYVHEGGQAARVFNQLRDLGVRLAIDDFGTGRSSLGYLLRHPVDAIKIDHDFIAGLGRSPASEIIIQALVQLAHGLGMTVVSEGVETSAQRLRLARLGVDACQGFYFAHPVTAAQLRALIAESTDGVITSLPRDGG